MKIYFLSHLEVFTSKATENGLTSDLKELFVRDQKLVLRLKHRLGIDRQFSLRVGVKSNRVKKICITCKSYLPFNE